MYHQADPDYLVSSIETYKGKIISQPITVDVHFIIEEEGLRAVTGDHSSLTSLIP